MWKGEVVGIFIAPEKTMSLVSQNEVLAVAGKGLEGDRYFKQVGTYSDRQSLTQEGVLEALTHRGGLCRPSAIMGHICWQPAKLAHFETREIMGWMEVWRAP